jgi:hypothetical protein
MVSIRTLLDPTVPIVPYTREEPDAFRVEDLPLSPLSLARVRGKEFESIEDKKEVFHQL